MIFDFLFLYLIIYLLFSVSLFSLFFRQNFTIPVSSPYFFFNNLARPWHKHIILCLRYLSPIFLVCYCCCLLSSYDGMVDGIHCSDHRIVVVVVVVYYYSLIFMCQIKRPLTRLLFIFFACYFLLKLILFLSFLFKFHFVFWCYCGELNFDGLDIIYPVWMCIIIFLQSKSSNIEL